MTTLSFYFRVAVVLWIAAASAIIYKDKIEIDNFNRWMPVYIAQANACVHAQQELMGERQSK